MQKCNSSKKLLINEIYRKLYKFLVCFPFYISPNKADKASALENATSVRTSKGLTYIDDQFQNN